MAKKEYDEYVKGYTDFMYDPDNIRKCDNCPENNGFDDWQDRLPCGQYHCWVSVHCKFNN